jgi:hypothetical protein
MLTRLLSVSIVWLVVIWSVVVTVPSCIVVVNAHHFSVSLMI